MLGGRRSVDEDLIEEVEEFDSFARDADAFEVSSRCRLHDAGCEASVKRAIEGDVGCVSDETIQFPALRDNERVEVLVPCHECQDLGLPGLEGFFGDVGQGDSVFDRSVKLRSG